MFRFSEKRYKTTQRPEVLVPLRRQMKPVVLTRTSSRHRGQRHAVSRLRPRHDSAACCVCAALANSLHALPEPAALGKLRTSCGNIGVLSACAPGPAHGPLGGGSTVVRAQVVGSTQEGP